MQIFANFGVKLIDRMNTNNKSNETLTTTHESCNIMVDLLQEYGVNDVIVSPGSRNAPIIIALTRCNNIRKHVIVDERSAAFIAIGIAQQTHKPVAILCTSGTALLNYAPAIAEAYYQQLPIIVISADRPQEWIDQNDSQTLKQFGSLSNIVKHSYDIPSNCQSSNDLWFCNRSINEALQCATALPNGPVHINLQLSEPLYDRQPIGQSYAKKINHFTPEIHSECVDEFAKRINSYRKVLIFASMHNKRDALTESLHKISGGNIVVLSEIIANNNTSSKIFHNIDCLFSEMNSDKWEALKPDLLITFGGAPVSRLAKLYLRAANDIEHWRIGVDNNIIDTMQNITQRIEVLPSIFFANKNIAYNANEEYYSQWKALYNRAKSNLNSFADNCKWSDFAAMRNIMRNISNQGTNLQISNGSSIRYADLLGVSPDFNGTVHCNRGVSGIDGSTSTALGASLANNTSTILITGDMSFSYDINGLASLYNSKQFKIIVLCNGGGGIFRFINGPSNLPDFEQYFEVNRDLQIDKFAHAFGFDYFKANSKQELEEVLPIFLNNNKESILAVFTNNEVSAQTLKEYYNRNK